MRGRAPTRASAIAPARAPEPGELAAAELAPECLSAQPLPELERGEADEADAGAILLLSRRRDEMPRVFGARGRAAASLSGGSSEPTGSLDSWLFGLGGGASSFSARRALLSRSNDLPLAICGAGNFTMGGMANGETRQPTASSARDIYPAAVSTSRSARTFAGQPAAGHRTIVSVFGLDAHVL